MKGCLRVLRLIHKRKTQTQITEMKVLVTWKSVAMKVIILIMEEKKKRWYQNQNHE